MDSDEHDPARLWHTAMERVCDLATGASDAALDARVPACPDWSGRDLLGHMVGLGADVLAGDEPADHDASWTRRQVEARRGRSTTALIAEWRALADDLVAWMHDHGSRPLNDVVIHEQDLRGSLRAPGAAATPELALVRDRMAERLGSSMAGLPPLALVGRSWSWCSAGPVEDAATRLDADDLDLFRALTSRRTAEQLRSWTTRGDVEAYLEAFAGLGPLPTEPLPGG